MGIARILVEFIRLNDEVVLGLSGPQLWSLALVALGLLLAWRTRVSSRLRWSTS